MLGVSPDLHFGCLQQPPKPALSRPCTRYQGGRRSAAAPLSASTPGPHSSPSDSSLPPWESREFQELDVRGAAASRQQQQPLLPPDDFRGGGAAARRSGALQQYSQNGSGALAESGWDKKDTLVEFCLEHHAEFGQRLRIVGSHPRLGSWMLSAGPDMVWSEGDVWRASIPLPSGSLYEYKYVLMDGWGQHALSWQQGNNCVLALVPGDEKIEVHDNWWGAPGAEVRARGVPSSTREKRLLSWANEVESTIASQRNDLRQTRVELTVAKDEARRSRMEVQTLKQELTVEKQNTVLAEARLLRTEGELRRTREQLAEANTSFQHALDLAQRLLTEVYDSDEEEEEGEASEEEEELVEGRGYGTGEEEGLEALSPEDRAAAARALAAVTGESVPRGTPGYPVTGKIGERRGY